jgi:phosphoglycerol transferase MdoB-like AlkP superfamily enzyme
MLAGMEKNLALDGWSAVSTLSEAPVWGGGSWMSYASALFGLSIENQAEYDAFKKKYSETEYPNMGRYFSSQGYEYVWVKPINRRLPENREAIDKLFYGPDRWITFNTLDYQGPMLGWGPSVPDQFTFGFIQEFASEQPQPTFLVFLTQNLHYPWTPLPPLVDEWQALENIDSEWIEAQDKGLSWNENYLQAVNHTFVSLEAFITSLEEKNSVIVLIGDHQPPAVSRHDDGFGTMVHIISQDIDLLDSFEEFGFVNGWVLENTRPVIRHEGFYSLFIRNFVAQYGENPWNTPPYLPNGSQ